jgi:hypothetical protein
MPLAYASTLDRCGVAAAARVIVEAFWSPALDSRTKMRRQKQPLGKQHYLPLFAGEGLSLSGGASIQFSVFLKLGITSSVVVDSPSNDEGDPLGSPSLRAAMPLGN